MTCAPKLNTREGILPAMPLDALSEWPAINAPISARSADTGTSPHPGDTAMYRDYVEDQYGLAGMTYTEQACWLGHSLPPHLDRRYGSTWTPAEQRVRPGSVDLKQFIKTKESRL